MLLRTNFYCHRCFLGIKRGSLEPHQPERNERKSDANVKALPNHRLSSFLACAVRPLTFRNVFIFLFFFISHRFTFYHTALCRSIRFVGLLPPPPATFYDTVWPAPAGNTKSTVTWGKPGLFDAWRVYPVKDRLCCWSTSSSTNLQEEIDYMGKKETRKKSFT